MDQEDIIGTSSGAWSSSDGSEEELVRELLDDVSPFFLIQEESTHEFNTGTSSSSSSPPQNVEVDHFRFNPATVYSGPTIEDIENALSVTAKKIQPQEFSPARYIQIYVYIHVYVHILTPTLSSQRVLFYTRLTLFVTSKRNCWF